MTNENSLSNSQSSSNNNSSQPNSNINLSADRTQSNEIKKAPEITVTPVTSTKATSIPSDDELIKSMQEKFLEGDGDRYGGEYLEFKRA